jgi:hypothetical protein
MTDKPNPGKGWATQYGIRWPAGSVFAFPSREHAEAALAVDGRGIGVLVVCEYKPHTPSSTEWREADPPAPGPDTEDTP